MYSPLKSVLTNLKKSFLREETIESVLLYGSIGRKQEDYYSDIDLLIYTKGKHKKREIEKVINLIYEVLIQSEGGVVKKFQKNEKWVLHTRKNFIKLEVGIKPLKRAEEDIIFIIQSRINKPNKSIFLDKKGKLGKILKERWFYLNEFERLEKTFHDMLNGFFYYYEIFLVNYARGDIYRAYMNYLLAFFKVASLMALSKGEYRNLYQPWDLTKDVLIKENLREISTEMDPLSIHEKKKIMIKAVKNFSLKVAKRFNINFNEEDFDSFIKLIDKKYPPFYNFRDIAKIVNYYSNNLKIKEGKIYRSASLSRYKVKEIYEYMKQKNIRYIIDLRGGEEKKIIEKKKKRKYPIWFAEKYIINVPFVNKSKNEYTYKQKYFKTVLENKKTIGKVFNNYLIKINENSIIIHCEVGKDRTGILIALLLDVLEIDRKIILKDFLSSYSDLKSEYLESLLYSIDNEYGGVIQFLTNCCGVKQENIKKIKEYLLKK